MGAPVDCAVCGAATTAATDRETYLPEQTLTDWGPGVQMEPVTVSTLGWVCDDCAAFANQYPEVGA